MHLIDWTIVILFIVGLLAMAIYVKRFNKGVAGFLTANRCAGRYLLSISQGISAMGAITFVALGEKYYNSGFCALWWGGAGLIGLISMWFTLSGWIIYRYRETRAMTMAQFFEIRYSKKFRVFTGILAWVSGIINMGIFPAVTARLFIYLCNLPDSYSMLGIECSTFMTIMVIELVIALAFTFLGGMLVVMITDFLQGIFCNITFLIILLFMLFYFPWDIIMEAVQTAPAGASLINPFDTAKADGFDIAFFMMFAFWMIYRRNAWQGNQGYNAAAKNAHEAKMAGIMGGLRGVIQNCLPVIIGVCAFVLMHHVQYAAQAQEVNQTLSAIGDVTLQKQMLVPLTLTKILPVGLLGLFIASQLAAAISTDDTYLHSWGCIFIQDVILPFRKKPFTPKQHIWLLRFSILFVAVFIFCFSLLYKQNDYIIMFMQVTGAIYLGGAGAVIVGGLYWKRGSTGAAWSSMIIGSGLAVGGLLIRSLWPDITPILQQWFPENGFLINNPQKFPYNGMYISFFSALIAVSTYILISLWSWLVVKDPAFNIDRMLHRGKYAIKGEHKGEVTKPPTGWRAILPSKEFPRSDKIIYWSLMGLTIFWKLVFIIVTVYHFIWGTTDAFWSVYWRVTIVYFVILGTVGTIWFFIGGLFDMRNMFKILKETVVNEHDDGRVVDHHSLVDEDLEKDKPEVMKELKQDNA